MGRKSIQDKKDNQILTPKEFEKILGKDYTSLNDEQKSDIALHLYQFTKLFVESLN
jgi:hypothetical protein